MISKKVTVNGVRYRVTAGWARSRVFANGWEWATIVRRLDNGEQDYTVPVYNGGRKRRGRISLPFQPMPS